MAAERFDSPDARGAGSAVPEGQTKQTVTLGRLRTCVPAIERLFAKIRVYAALDGPVLIEGETGVGKELVAQALHELSARASGPFVTIDCGSLPESLLESELFGHERGSFTGAERAYGGRIGGADAGTVFLDEVNALSRTAQAKLLRFIETKELTRVGQRRLVPVDIRLVAASNRPLEELVASGEMRADFFHRLNVLRLTIPPLRERTADMPLLVRQFLAEDPIAVQLGVTDVSPDVVAALCAYHWPGNVRELHNLLRRSVVFGSRGGTLCHLEWSPQATDAAAARGAVTDRQLQLGLREWIRNSEREYFRNLLCRYPTANAQATVARLPPRTLYRRLRSLGIRATGS